MPWEIIIGLANLVMIGLIVPIYRHVSSLRHNEMHHIWETLRRIEDTLLRHIEHHEK